MHRPARALAGALLSAAVLAAAPTAATAGTVAYDQAGALTYTGAPGETNDVVFALAGDGSGRLLVSDVRAGGVGAPAVDCEAVDAFSAWCRLPSALRAELGDGDDRASVTEALGLPGAVRLEGGPGNDRLEGPFGPVTAETLDGGPGDDTLKGAGGADMLLGGDGRDTLDGGAGDDRLDAGAGDDLLHGDRFEAPGTDLIDGGPGRDTFDEDWTDRAASGTVPVSATLGGGADDGRPGENDDLRSIERVRAYQPGNFTGTDGADEIEVVQVGEASVLRGLGGGDRLKASDGPDEVDGGAGDDEIDAGFGDDRITGGPGRDRIAADRPGGDCGPAWCRLPFGNDVVDARDGEADSVTCGAGTDRVLADAVDVVAPDCEQVERGAGAAGPSSRPAAGAPRLTVLGPLRLGAVRRSGLRVRLSGFSAGRVTLTAHAGRRLVTRRTTTVRAGRSAVLTLRPGRALRGRGPVRLILRAGTARAVVTLRR